MSTVHTTTASLDRPNGDLKPGDYFIITAWCGARAYVRTASSILGSQEVPCEQECEGARPNRVGVGTVLWRMEAVDYPAAVVTCFHEGGESHRTTLPVTEFEARKPSAEFVAAYLKPVPKRPESAQAPNPKRRDWREILPLILVGLGVLLLACNALARGGR